MTPDLANVLARVQTDLGDIIDAIDRDGPRYARAYAEHVHHGRPQPHPRGGLVGLPARIIRELVLDEVAANRRGITR